MFLLPTAGHLMEAGGGGGRVDVGLGYGVFL